jgi:hypothetical protein
MYRLKSSKINLIPSSIAFSTPKKVKGTVKPLKYLLPGSVLPPELYFSVWDEIHYPEVESKAQRKPRDY